MLMFSSKFSEVFGISIGDVVSIIGCGGKTSLMYRLCEENKEKSVLMSTTTKIYMPESDKYDNLLYDDNKEIDLGINLLCGKIIGEKIVGVDIDVVKNLRPISGITILECDGSKGFPFKGWAEYEPVIPDFTNITIGVCILNGVGERISSSNTHRPELFCQMTKSIVGEIATLENLSDMIIHKDGLFSKAKGKRILYINKVESAENTIDALKLIEILPDKFKKNLDKIVIGSLKNDFCKIIRHNK